MKHFSSKLRRVVLGVGLLGAVASAQAGGFSCITGTTGVGTDAKGCSALGESLLSWSLAGDVLTISNQAAAGSAAFVSGISFAAASGQTVSLADAQMDGVAFVNGGVGANLPASLGWNITYEASAANKPARSDVDPGEAIAFKVSGVSASDITSGAFKFGVHLQALPLDRSEKLVASVPEPETYALGLAGLVVVTGLSRRRGLSRP